MTIKLFDHPLSQSGGPEVVLKGIRFAPEFK